MCRNVDGYSLFGFYLICFALMVVLVRGLLLRGFDVLLYS